MSGPIPTRKMPANLVEALCRRACKVQGDDPDAIWRTTGQPEWRRFEIAAENALWWHVLIGEMIADHGPIIPAAVENGGE